MPHAARTACLRVCGARARVRACACARMCVFACVLHVQELRPRCWLRTPALATLRPSMKLIYAVGWRPRHRPGQPERACGWYWDHNMASRAPTQRARVPLSLFHRARQRGVRTSRTSCGREVCVLSHTSTPATTRLAPNRGDRAVACYALTTGRANEARASTRSAPNNSAIAAVLPSSSQSTRTITSATGRKHGGYAAAHARAADRLVVLNRPSGNVHGSARSAQKDRGCIVCHGMKSVRPRNGAIPFSARTVGRVEGAPRDMARQPCVQGAVQLSTRATRLLLCGTR